MRNFIALFMIALITPLAGRAEPPRVITDIAPIHSLVAQVMQGVAAPDLLIPPGSSPHGYALRPSQARNLAKADIVVWVGPEQTPWLAETIQTLAPNAHGLALLDTEGTLTLAYREEAEFSHEEEGHEEEGHEEEGHEEGEDHEDEDGHDHHDHHDGIDPHAWLDPQNAQVWLTHIATTLSQVDPANAERYRANARDGIANLKEIEAQIVQQLSPLNRGYLTFHDAYQYFETRFEIPAVGSLSPSDATSPGPARLSALRDVVASRDIVCLFSEPQLSRKKAEVLASDLNLRIGSLDPIGASYAPGPELYRAMLMGLAGSLSDCLGG